MLELWQVLKNVKTRVWAFDAEWVPDPLAGRLVYDLPDPAGPPEAVMQAMWQKGGATAEDPTPFLKTVLCRVVSIAALERRVDSDGSVVLNLMSLPHASAEADGASEAEILSTFLTAIGEHKPQLVGFNSIDSDVQIMLQRAVILGLQAALGTVWWCIVKNSCHCMNSHKSIHECALAASVAGAGRAREPGEL